LTDITGSSFGCSISTVRIAILVGSAMAFSISTVATVRAAGGAAS